MLIYLMGSANQIHVVFVEEFGDYFGSECEADSSIVFAPSHRVLVGVRPQQIAKETLVGDICRPHDTANLFHTLEIGTEATVTAKDLFVNNGGNGQAVETVRKRLPQFDVVEPLALVVEAVDAVNRCTLVIAAKQKEVFRVLDLVG